MTSVRKPPATSRQRHPGFLIAQGPAGWDKKIRPKTDFCLPEKGRAMDLRELPDEFYCVVPSVLVPSGVPVPVVQVSTFLFTSGQRPSLHMVFFMLLGFIQAGSIGTRCRSGGIGISAAIVNILIIHSVRRIFLQFSHTVIGTARVRARTVSRHDCTAAQHHCCRKKKYCHFFTNARLHSFSS
ncbi:hypothetical protein SG0892 [Sodalis glossinidius str. 'morsitans']|uniref:Uncharacterized protein n=1 Tax=Sodalis glossinidius (strain morsitans) TaxID=343509 RepID=Q2NUK8_SODGM|nr:hypothetical protein SG0892 [Sodalis glossinidius str. 'morsitans']